MAHKPLSDMPPIVPTPAAALAQLGLTADRRVRDFTDQEMQAFRLLIGWDPGGPVVAYPTAPERAARQRRERWKRERAGRGQAQPCLLLRAENLRTFRANVERHANTRRWYGRLMELATQVAELPLSRFAEIIPEQGPWNVAGSFCPHCVGDKSDYTIHHPFWRWSPLAPERIQCPHCGIVYPHPDYPEAGHLELPRLGLRYAFYLSPREQASPDWREGRHASSFGGAPTHVSLSGEVRRCALSWALGQVEPLGVAYAVSGEARYARAAAAILERLAVVYPGYPVYSYRQEYSDAEPAFAVAQVDALPTPFKRAAFHYTYSGRWGDAADLHGKQETTAAVSAYPNGEWGTSRLGREKASNGQLFLSLFKGYDLIKETLSADLRTRIEADFLLELYLDTRGLSRHCDNKAGPGAAARVAVGVFYDDQEELDAGVAQFRQVVAGQFHADGSWKETPIYGAKALFEGMAEIPELLRGRVDLYAEPLYRLAFATYARAGTPLGTQPALGDSPAGYCVQTYLGDLARIRLGVEVPSGPERLEGFDLLQPERVSSSTGYVAGLECMGTEEPEEVAPAGAEAAQCVRVKKPEAGTRGEPGPVKAEAAKASGREPRTPGDPGSAAISVPLQVGLLPPRTGFAEVGNTQRRAGRLSAVSMFTESLPHPPTAPHVALNHFFHGRGLACVGWGSGTQAVQLYLNGDDGRGAHRHADPLSITLFAAGREVLPDLGYIADHPANGWLRCTASHNTVTVNGGSVRATEPGTLRGWEMGETWRFCDLSVPVAPPGEARTLALLRRALVLLRLPGEGMLLVDLFDVEGGETHDYLVRVNDPERCFQMRGAAASHAGQSRVRSAPGQAPPAPSGLTENPGPASLAELAFVPRPEALFQEVATPPRDFHTAGSCAAPLRAQWGERFRVMAHVFSPGAEVIRFQSPAWRDAHEVFADPRRAWDTLCLRCHGTRTRFAVVYAVTPGSAHPGEGRPSEEQDPRSGLSARQHDVRVDLVALTPELVVRVETWGGARQVSLGAGCCRVRDL